MRKPNTNSREGHNSPVEPPPRLTGGERAAAQAAGMSKRRYAALKDVQNLDDWDRLQAAEKRASGTRRAQGGGR